MGASLLIQALRAHPIVIATGSPSTTAEILTEGASWETAAKPIGALGKLTKPERRAFEKQRVRVRATVTELADAVALHPAGSLSAAAGRHMSRAAARSLSKQAPVLPKGADAITILQRSGRISVQAPRFAAAAAELHIVMRATVGDRLVKWRNAFRFWLQRADGKWRVISFDIDRAQR